MEARQHITSFLGCPFRVHLGLRSRPSYVKILLKSSICGHAKKVCLEQSIFIVSNLLVKSYGGTIYVKGKEKFKLILHIDRNWRTFRVNVDRAISLFPKYSVGQLSGFLPPIHLRKV